MCGIAGILTPGGGADIGAQADRMIATLGHRGPDGREVQVRGPVALAHARLSIIDLAGGTQPLSNEDGQVWITFNGEIYNYRALRDALRQRGHQFRTESDTEVIVHAYEEWGDDCVLHLRGMFAFAIADHRRGRLLLARDHFGIKPLWYAQVGGGIAFASEVTALRAVPGLAWTPDLRAIDEFLALQYIPAPRSAWRDVSKLPPAHRLVIEFDGRLRGPERYWRPPVGQPSPLAPHEYRDALGAALDDSVRAHLIADVPVGAFLSGGLDSTATSAAAQRAMSHPLHTFSIGFGEAAFDETEYADAAVRQIGSVHRRGLVTRDALALLPELVRQFGEPFGDASAVATWEVARLAATDVKTVITGDGGDEAMAGYHAHQVWLQWLAAQPEAVRANPPLEAWLRIVQYLAPDVRSQLWRRDHHGTVLQPIESFEAAWAESRDLGAVHRVQYMDAVTYLPNDILTKVDITSMRHSLETRTPLIDVPFWDVAVRMPESAHVGLAPDGTVAGKQLLKALLEPQFGRDFVHRRKRGFAMPIREWLPPGGAAAALVHDRLVAHGSALHEWFDPAMVRAIANSTHTGGIWLLLMLDEWLQQQRVPVVADGPVRVAPTPVVPSGPPIVAPTAVTALASPAARRPRILVIADVPNWIFERHARTLRDALADEFEIVVHYHTEPYDESAYDLIYPMQFRLVPPERITAPWKYVTGLRSHLSWDGVSPAELARFLARHFQRTHVVSARLRDELAPFLPDVAYVTHGVDGARFRRIDRQRAPGAPLRVGWAGNRANPVKGFGEFIAPLQELPGVEVVFCGYSDRNLTLDEMPAFYAAIDVYICTSATEGNNNSLLEAAATGAALITTDTGTVPEYLRHEVSALIVPRTADAFRAAVVRLRDDVALRERMGRAAASAVHPAWTWAARVDEYRRFFRDAVQGVPAAQARMTGQVTPPTAPVAVNLAAEVDAVQRALAAGRTAQALEGLQRLVAADPANPVWPSLVDEVQRTTRAA